MNSQLNNNNGLTLIQTLIVVAIVVILLGVTLIGIQALVDRINQTKLDNVAQSMYVSAQNRIRELKASGEIASLLSNTELIAVAAKPADWGEIDSVDTVDYLDLKYVYHIKDNPTDSTPRDLVDFIFPQGSIDGNVLNDNWVIEFDPVTGYVYSAFYSESRSSDDYYINNTSTLDQSGTSSIRFKDFRHSLKGNNKIGYYGGKANMPADLGGDAINASLNIINADILKANMTTILPSDSEISALEFKLTVKGKASGKTVTLTQTVAPESLVPAKVFSASVILDKLEAGQNFKNTFGNENWKPSGVERTEGALIPGEDLELSFTVSSNEVSVLDVGPITRTVNSLFASFNPDIPTEANIAYGRHLQNLDRSTSGLPATAVTSAKQISDIDFNDASDSESTPPAEEPFLWKSIYGDKTFTPINNQDLTKYSGYNPEYAPDSFKILHMHIDDSNEQAGLFGNFAGNEISGVTMVNEKIDGGTNVGGLAGTTTATSNLTIKDCRLYVERDRFATGSTYVNNILFNGTSNVGGLVGSSTAANITIKDSFASTIIEGRGAIGGLIGSHAGDILIQDSYADSYLIGGAATSKIGGLAGELTAGSSAITGSYSAGFGMIKNGVTDIVSAAGFVPNIISSVTNSYSLFNSSESKATTRYSTTAPSATTTVAKVYYFGPDENKLTGSQKYEFLSIAAAANDLGRNFSDDDNKYDTYPYNQQTFPELLVTYPYVSITGLPHYGDWEIPPIQEKLEFGRAGLFYWENVTGGSAPGYQIYMVGRKGEPGKYEAVYHDTTNVAHNDKGIIKEYGYGYYVAKKGEGNETYTLGKSWSNNVNVPTDANRNASAESSFNNNSDYSNYVFTCYNTCNEANPATSYNIAGSNENKYMFMKGNAQNATVTLTPEDEAALVYTFCPFFAKSIKLTGWNSWDWNYTVLKPALHNNPGTANNQYRIRSLDQLQFINWNSAGVDEKCSQWVLRDNYAKFPYLHATKIASLIYYSYLNGWTYYGLTTTEGPEVSKGFADSRANQNFIQDFDIECIGRADYTPIAALGDTTGPQVDSFRLPLFAWFGGSYDGQSYKIKNLSITSSCHSVGVFGVTVSSTIENVVLIRDSRNNIPVIERPADSPRGFYAIGTLVGIANEYSKGTHSPAAAYPNWSTGTYEGVIKNCAVAGYEVIDKSSKPVTCGETAIGGLAGVLRTNIDRCSAVTTIKLETKNDRGDAVADDLVVVYGDYISVGGIAGRNQTRINNCYSGGEVIVDELLTEPKIYISGIAASAVTPRFVNISNSDARLFRKTEYNNCYSYMKLPEPTDNIRVGTIAANANYMFTGYPLLFYIGGNISKCYYYDEYFEIGQELVPQEKYLNTDHWTGQSFERTYDVMSHEDFCTELNSSAFHQVTPYHYSFPCGEMSLEGSDYPFPAVITQTHKNNSSDPNGIKYVHYGEWPKKRGLELTNPAMELDLISYHEGAGNIVVGDYFNETEVKYYDSSGILQNISLSNLEIRKTDGQWVKFVAIDDRTVMIDDKIKVSASEIEGVCKLTVTGIDKTEGTEIIPLRYLVNDKYSSVALSVNVTAVVNLSSANPNPITATVKTGETVRWNLILKDKNDKLIDTGDISAEMGLGGNWEVTPNPSDVFSYSITKAGATMDDSPFYLEATALKPGEADFTVQALNIKVRDVTNTDNEGNRRTVNSNELDLHALCYSGKLILKHYGTEGYVENRYIYKNGDSGISPDLMSDTNKSFTDLNGEMEEKIPAIIPAPTFEGWYVKDAVNGNHEKLLNTEGQIVNNIENISQDFKFSVNPEGDIELYAMWKISCNRLTFVNTTGRLPSDGNKYLVIARVPHVGDNPVYYCMTGESPPGPGENNSVTAIQVDLQQSQGEYYLISPIRENTMLWYVRTFMQENYFRLFNDHLVTYIKSRNKNADGDVVFCSLTSATAKPAYNSATHNLYFQSNWRILFDNNNKKFIFEKSNQGVIDDTNLDGGIWLFEYSTTTVERLHEFK